LFAKIDFLVEDADEAILDLEMDFGAGFDVGGESALGGDDEVGAAVEESLLGFFVNECG